MRWRPSLALIVLHVTACKGPGGDPEQPDLQAPGSASAVIAARTQPQQSALRSARRTPKTGARPVTREPTSAPGPRIFALDTRVYIRQRPSENAPEIGALRIGQALALKSREPQRGPGCATGPLSDSAGSGSAGAGRAAPDSAASSSSEPAAHGPAPSTAKPQRTGWYAVEPEGYVCLDRATTLDPEHPLVRAKLRHHARFDQDKPLKWGESLEAPIYKRYPTDTEQAKSEYQLRRHLDAADSVREATDAGEPPPARALARLRGADTQLSSRSAPAFLAAHQDSPWVSALWPGDPRPRISFVPARSSISWTDEFTAGGRTWLLTPELTVVPKDRVLELKPSDYHGIFLTENIKLPIAFMRFEDRAKWRLVSADQEAAFAQPSELVPVSQPASAPEQVEDTDDSGRFVDDAAGAPGRLVKTQQRWERLGHVQLTGRARWQRGQRYFETREPGVWIAQTDAALAREWAPRGIPLGPDEKWLDVSIFHGTLVAYVGTRPVFTTLISPGANGYKRRSGPARKNTTPSGTFRIEWKHTATTMSPDPEKKRYYLTDVPFTQFFHMPFALHAAYWHDRFGEPKSGGCVNLSVKDARWLFNWTEPQLPDGWYSVRSGGARGEGTWVRVR